MMVLFYLSFDRIYPRTNCVQGVTGSSYVTFTYIYCVICHYQCTQYTLPTKYSTFTQSKLLYGYE